MQSYREDGPSRPVAQLDPLPAPSGVNDDMGKYKARYEEAMNPFEAFRGRVLLIPRCGDLPTNSILGSRTGISKSQPCGTRSAGCYSGYSWESASTDFPHLLHTGTPSTGHVHDIRVYSNLRHSAPKAAIKTALGFALSSIIIIFSYGIIYSNTLCPWWSSAIMEIKSVVNCVQDRLHSL
jgi:hypothetical protein